MLLTEEEKIKFANYLENEIKSGRALVDQMKIINAPNELIKAYQLEIASSIVVRNKLISTEHQEIK